MPGKKHTHGGTQMTDMPEDRPDEESIAPDEPVSTREVPTDAEWDIVVQTAVDVAAGEDLTSTIVYAIANAEGVAPGGIKEPPLYEVIDTRALESAFFGPTDGQTADLTGCSAEFMYRGYRVVVQNDGWVFVYERAT